MDNYLTVGDLRKALVGLPKDTPVYYERIEDLYFNKHGWKPDLFVPDDFDPGVGTDSQFVRAFTAFSYKDEKGKHICITAHY